MMNKVILIGRLVASPELITTAAGKSLVRTALAVSRRFKNEKGDREADFLNIVIWGKNAENFTAYAKKGSLISIEGELRARSYEDKEQQRHYVTEVLCNYYHLLESKAAVALREGTMSPEDIIMGAGESDLPF